MAGDLKPSAWPSRILRRRGGQPIDLAQRSVALRHRRAALRQEAEPTARALEQGKSRSSPQTGESAMLTAGWVTPSTGRRRDR